METVTDMPKKTLSLKKPATPAPAPVEPVVVPPVVQAAPVPEMTEAQAKLNGLALMARTYFNTKPVAQPLQIDGKLRLRPLGNSVRKDLAEWLATQQEAESCTPRVLYNAASKGVLHHVFTSLYSRSILTIKDRYGLEGNVDGEVTDLQVADAKKQLKKLKKRHKPTKATQIVTVET